MKPLVGIITKPLSDFECPDDIRRELYVKDDFRKIVYKNGCSAIGILAPFQNDKFNAKGDMTIDNLTSEEKEDLELVISKCDGIILQGGMSGDFYELHAARFAIENDIPIIGICAGFNTIARAAGCNIVSGETLGISSKNHSVYKKEFRHEVDVSKNTLLHKVFHQDKIKVSSLHTWYLEETEAFDNPRIEINATVEDMTFDGGSCKTVECITVKDTRFAMGIKWHPEYMEEEHFQKIFAPFFEACKSSCRQ